MFSSHVLSYVSHFRSNSIVYHKQPAGLLMFVLSLCYYVFIFLLLFFLLLGFKDTNRPTGSFPLESLPQNDKSFLLSFISCFFLFCLWVIFFFYLLVVILFLSLSLSLSLSLFPSISIYLFIYIYLASYLSMSISKGFSSSDVSTSFF